MDFGPVPATSEEAEAELAPLLDWLASFRALQERASLAVREVTDRQAEAVAKAQRAAFLTGLLGAYGA